VHYHFPCWYGDKSAQFCQVRKNKIKNAYARISTDGIKFTKFPTGIASSHRPYWILQHYLSKAEILSAGKWMRYLTSFIPPSFIWFTQPPRTIYATKKINLITYSTTLLVSCSVRSCTRSSLAGHNNIMYYIYSTVCTRSYVQYNSLACLHVNNEGSPPSNNIKAEGSIKQSIKAGRTRTKGKK